MWSGEELFLISRILLVLHSKPDASVVCLWSRHFSFSSSFTSASSPTHSAPVAPRIRCAPEYALVSLLARQRLGDGNEDKCGRESHGERRRL